MRRVEKISLLLLLISVLFLSARNVSAAREKVLERSHDKIVEGFVTELVDGALEPQIRPPRRDELLKRALGFARAYSVISGDYDFYHETKRRILTTPARSVAEEENIIKYIQEKTLWRKIKKGVGGLVESIIEEAFEPGTTPARKDALLETAKRVAEAYSKKIDDDIFYQYTQRLIQTIPPPDISGDEEIIKEFQKAMLKDNRLVMRLLVKKIEPRIEPFVAKIVARIQKPETPEAEKELLVKTTMNIVKTQAKMRADHTFHRKVHRRVFTALLTEPVKPEKVDGVNIVYAPKSSKKVKNVFRPDNIVIRAGETVRWVNQDNTTHVIGTQDFPSDGHFLAPNVGPGKVFEHTFLKPGEYYYICFIHNSMVGKITVEE
ncbi:MAG: plastocyanin/azurin family copper-binding protein [Thermodesulfobacteriota bacterium]